MEIDTLANQHEVFGLGALEHNFIKFWSILGHCGMTQNKKVDQLTRWKSELTISLFSSQEA